MTVSGIVSSTGRLVRKIDSGVSVQQASGQRRLKKIVACKEIANFVDFAVADQQRIGKRQIGKARGVRARRRELGCVGRPDQRGHVGIHVSRQRFHRHRRKLDNPTRVRLDVGRFRTTVCAVDDIQAQRVRIIGGISSWRHSQALRIEQPGASKRVGCYNPARLVHFISLLMCQAEHVEMPVVGIEGQASQVDNTGGSQINPCDGSSSGVCRMKWPTLLPALDPDNLVAGAIQQEQAFVPGIEGHPLGCGHIQVSGRRARYSTPVPDVNGYQLAACPVKQQQLARPVVKGRIGEVVHVD